MSDGMCKTGTGGKGKGDRAPSEMVITRPYADVDSSYTIQDDINPLLISIHFRSVVVVGGGVDGRHDDTRL